MHPGLLPSLLALFFALFAIPLAAPFLRAAETTAPTPDPRQQMLGEITALRTAQTLSVLNLSAPPTETEIDARKKTYFDLIQRFPWEAEPHVAFGEYLSYLAQNEAAYQQWSIALTLEPLRHDVMAAQSDLLLQTGQIVAAADTLEKALRLAPQEAAYHYALAHLYTLFRRDLIATRQLPENELITRGTEYFRRAAELAPDNLAYAQAYAEAFYTQPDPDWTLARNAWETLLVRSSEKDFIRGHLVRVNIRLRDKAAAQNHLAALTNPAFATMREKLQKQIDSL